MGRLMRRRSTTTTDDAAPAPALEPETAAERRCCRLRDAALSRNVRVRFLFDEIAKLGCDVGSPFGFVRCASVDRSGPLGDEVVGGVAVNAGSQRRCAPGVEAEQRGGLSERVCQVGAGRESLRKQSLRG